MEATVRTETDFTTSTDSEFLSRYMKKVAQSNQCQVLPKDITQWAVKQGSGSWAERG